MTASTKIFKIGTAGALGLLAFAFVISTGTSFAAAPNYLLDGSAKLVGMGSGAKKVIELDSTTSGESGGIGLLNLPAGLKAKDITGLSYDYRTLTGDCGPGSPRFMLGIDVNGNGVVDGNEWALVHFYNSSTCQSASWKNSGNLLNPAKAQLELHGMNPSLTFPSTPQDLVSNFGNYPVLKMDVEVDGYTSTNLQRFQFDNIKVTTAAQTLSYSFDPAGSASSADPSTPIKVPTSIDTGDGGFAAQNSTAAVIAAVAFGAACLIAFAKRRVGAARK